MACCLTTLNNRNASLKHNQPICKNCPLHRGRLKTPWMFRHLFPLHVHVLLQSVVSVVDGAYSVTHAHLSPLLVAHALCIENTNCEEQKHNLIRFKVPKSMLMSVKVSQAFSSKLYKLYRS